MDPISTALTVAWLDAVRRAQSADLQHYLQQAPQTAPSRDERTLTDVIQRAIENGGASPDQAPAPQASQSPYLVDRLA